MFRLAITGRLSLWSEAVSPDTANDPSRSRVVEWKVVEAAAETSRPASGSETVV